MRFTLDIGKEFRNRVQDLVAADGYTVESGHFLSDGLHHSGMSYPEIMMLHHVGTNRMPARPVLSFMELTLLSSDVLNKPLERWIGGKGNFKTMLSNLGVAMRDTEVGIMGNPAYLDVTTNPTPLVDTGDLVSAIRYEVKKT